MAVRSTMLPLIQMVRDLTGDSLGDVPLVFSDQQVQNWLDKRRLTVRYELLRAEEFLQPGGKIVYQDFYAQWEFWEQDATLYSSTYTPFVADDFAEADFLTGHWQTKVAQLPLVYLIGKTYDVYGAAADLCEAWAAKLSGDYDFSDKQVSFKRSQAFAQKRTQANDFKRQARPRTVSQGRSDVEDGSGTSGLQDAIHKILTNPF